MNDTPLAVLIDSDGPRFWRTLLEAWGRGLAVAPLDPGWPDELMREAIDFLRPAFVIEGETWHARSTTTPVLSGTALCIRTSGTSGSGKWVLLSWDALSASYEIVRERIGFDASDRWLACMPFHHIGGMSPLVRSWLAGSEPVVVRPFAVARIAAESRARLMSVVPTMLRRLVEASIDLRRYRAVLVGGAAADPSLLTASGAIATYGMTETCGGCIFDGSPLRGVDFKLDDDSRIYLRGPTLFSGFVGSADSGLSDGWLKTDDWGLMEGGLLREVGRLDDVIITGGENVSPTDVERALMTHPDIADALVFGIKDDEFGQIVAAVLVVRRPLSEEAIREHVGAAGLRLKPRRILFVDEIPRSDMGKPDKDRLLLLFKN